MKTKRTPKSAWLAAVATLCACANTTALADLVQARQADAFVASTAVGTQWSKTDSANRPFPGVYMRKFDELSDMLIDSGIRHIRDSGNSDDFIKKIQRLSDAGVKSIITLTPSSGLRPDSSYWASAPAYNNASTPVYNIDSFIRKAGRDTIAYVEMNSNLDTTARRAGTFWHAADTTPLSDNPSSEFYYINYIKAATASAAASLLADPALADIPLIGPAFATIASGSSAYTDAGNLGDLVDYSNIQHYYSGMEPETTTAQGIDFAVANGSEVQALGKGRVVSEGGESTVNGSLRDIWPPVVQGRYMPRYFLEHYIKGFAITTARELVDVEWNPTAGTPDAVKANNHGLIQNNLAPKPAYAAIKNILSVLKDPGPSFTAGSLDYTMGGATGNVHSVLFQKRNGDFYLCLWLGIASYDPASGVISDNPPQTVSITVPGSIQGAHVFTLDDSGEMTSAGVPINANTVSVSVTDRVTIVRLSAAASGGTASMPIGLRTVSAAGQITLKWSPVFEAASYAVKRATSAGGTYAPVASGLTATEYIDTNATSESVVYYTVIAVSPGGESVPSTPVSAVPYKPIIDNADTAPEVTRIGSWANSTSPCYSTAYPTYFYGANVVTDGNTGKGEKAFTYTPAIPHAGSYDVYIRWTASSNRTSAAPVTITHADGTRTLTVNQDIDGGAWRLLGTYNFAAGMAGSLTIKNEGTADGYVVADAARFNIASPRPPAGLVTTNGASPVNLNWQAVANTDGYIVRRSTSPNGPWDVLATGVTATSFADSTAADETFYYYAVSSVNAGLEGVSTSPMVGTAGMKPIIASVATLTATEGDLFQYQIKADYLPISYNATGLPPGLSINTATGLISGRLTEGGEFTVALSATNATGTGTATLSLSVIPLTEPPVINSPTSVTCTVNDAFLYAIEASNVPLGYAATGLPEGLSLNEETGEISGAPTTGGTYTIIISVHNKIGVTTTEVTITINNDLQLLPLADASAGLVDPAAGVFDAAGNLYVVEAGAGVIKKITSAGVASIFATVNAVTSVARGPDDVLYAAGSDGNVTKILADGTLVTPAFATGLGSIGGIAVGHEGTVYVATTGNITGGVTVKLIKTITPDGEVRNLVLASDQADSSASLSLNNATNDLWFADTAAGTLKKIVAPTGLMVTSVSNLDEPRAVAIDAAGLVYILDTQTGVIHAHDPVSRKTLTIFDNSEGALDHPSGIAIDGDGLLHVMDTGNQTVRIITTSPILVSPLTNRTAAVNSTVTLDGTVLASPSPIYQWYKDGVPIAGATKAYFEISPVKDGDAGNYVIIATNAIAKNTDGMMLTVSGTEPIGDPEQPDSGGGGGGGATSLWFFTAFGLLALLRRFVSQHTK